jgi:hypothetical protein
LKLSVVVRVNPFATGDFLQAVKVRMRINEEQAAGKCRFIILIWKEDFIFWN